MTTEWRWITCWWAGLAIATLFLARSLHRVINKIFRTRDKPRSGILQDLTPTLNDAKFHIIAVPGLGAHPYHTWEAPTSPEPNTAESEVPKSAKVHLLKDLLPRVFPGARIWNFVHDSTWLIDAPVKTTEEIGACLLKEIKAKHQVSRLPIIFIGHSMGGIIIKQALCRSESQDVIEYTAGVIFLGVPHQGSSASTAGALLAYWTGVLGSDTTLLLSLRHHDAGLSNLAASFGSCIASNERRQRSIPIISFYETRKTYFLGVSLGIVVSRDSATVHADANASYSIETDHSGLNKCSGLDDTAFTQLKMAIMQLRVPPLLAQADDWIHYRHYTSERLRIERLSGQALALDQCYINLAIVERHSQGAPQPIKQETTPYSFSLFYRQKIDIPPETMQVDLSNLFSEREGSNGRLMRPRRILIRGRAGVGKTTLCKKIVSEFTKGTWGKWNELFDRVLWVPLRNLKLPERCNNPKYTFEDLLSHEFLLPTNAPNLAKELSGILETENNKTLFLLDGLDEVSQGLAHDGGMYRFLTRLLKQPNTIITSRPSTRPPPNLDLELETIGFSLDQVHEYIEKSFINPDTGEKQQTIIDKVKSFLADRWLIQELVRIPIQLDAFCYTWEELAPETVPSTMTGMYKTLVQMLLKKDIVRLGKVNRDYTEDAHAAEIENMVTPEIELVECLAFNGLYNDIVDFGPLHRAKMVKLWPAQKLSLDETLSRLSFFRTSNIEPRVAHRTYHFIHLTYQEYFAAQYFVRQWRDPDGQLQTIAFDSKDETTETTRPVEFLRKQKYTARFDIFWRFVAGLLDGVGQAVSIISAIEEKPVDLLGPTHQRLIMRCLSEIPSNLPRRAALEAEMAQWLLFECRFHHTAGLAMDIEFPEAALKTALLYKAGDNQTLILDSLTARAFISSSMLEHVAAYLSDVDKDVRGAAVKLLGGRSVPDEMLAAVAKRLDDDDSHVRRITVMTLGCRSALPDEMLAAVVGRLDDENNSVRASAVEVLSKRLALPDDALAAVARRLDEEDWFIRKVTVEALGGRATLPDKMLLAVAKRLDDNNQDVQRTAMEILRGRPTLPNTVLASITKKINDRNSSVSIPAIQVFSRWPVLPDEVLVAVVGKLKKGNWSKSDAVELLGRESALPNEVLVAGWFDKSLFIQRAALIALGERSTLPIEVLALVANRLDDTHATIRRAAVRVFGKSLALSDEVREAITRRLNDTDKTVRKAAVEVLGGKPALPEKVVEGVACRLDDKAPTVQKAAIMVLGDRPILPDKILAAMMRLLDSRDETIREAAVEALGKRSELPDNVLAAVARRLDDYDFRVRAAATQTLGSRSVLPIEILAAITRQLDDRSLQDTTVKVLGKRPVLPDSVLAHLVRLLNDKNSFTRAAVIEGLGGRLTLPDEVLAAIVGLAEDEEPRVRIAVIEALGVRLVLPDTVLVAIARHLYDKDWLVRRFAVSVLQKRPILPDDALVVVAKGLDDETWFVRRTSMDFLASNSALPDEVLIALGRRLDEKDWFVWMDAISALIRNQDRLYRTRPLITLLHKALLIRSFQQHISWYVEESSAFINTPDGILELAITTPVPKVEEWIRGARPAWCPYESS